MTYRQISFHLVALALLLALLGVVYWQHTGERAVPGLIESLQSGDLQTQILAAQGLRHIGQPAQAALPILLELATAEDKSPIQTEAARAVPPIDLSGARKVMMSWLPKLQDPDPQVRRDAAAALGALGPVAKPAVHSLLGIANDPNTMVRDRVIRALAAIALPPELVAQGLIQALHDAEWTVRYAAVTSFAFSGVVNPESLAALRPLTQDPNQMVARLAQSAVASAERPIPASVHIFSLKQAGDRTLAFVQLARFGPRAADAVPSLSELLTAERPLERYMAACALQSMGSAATPALPALQRSLEDSDPVVREAAAEALHAIETRRP